jgi:hypothetical protein
MFNGDASPCIIVLEIARKRSGLGRGTLVAYLRLIDDESEFELLRGELEDPLEREVRAMADDLLNGRQEPPLQIRMHGLNLGKAKAGVESEIRHTVVEALVENALAQWREARLEPQDILPLDEDAAISVSLGGLSLPQSLGGLDLPPADTRRIEARVQQKIQSIVAPYTPPSNGAADGDDLGPTLQTHGGPSSCICVHNTPTSPMKITTPDGTPTTDLSVLDPSMPPPPSPYRIGFYPIENARIFIGMTVSRSVEFPGNQMIISLASETAWAKAIEAWNFCAGRQAEVYQGGPSTVPNEMTIFEGCGPGHTDTLNFNKPGFLGIWGTVYRPNESDFWAMLRGRRVDFVWVRD